MTIHFRGQSQLYFFFEMEHCGHWPGSAANTHPVPSLQNHHGSGHPHLNFRESVAWLQRNQVGWDRAREEPSHAGNLKNQPPTSSGQHSSLPFWSRENWLEKKKEEKDQNKDYNMQLPITHLSAWGRDGMRGLSCSTTTTLFFSSSGQQPIKHLPAKPAPLCPPGQAGAHMWFPTSPLPSNPHWCHIPKHVSTTSLLGWFANTFHSALATFLSDWSSLSKSQRRRGRKQQFYSMNCPLSIWLEPLSSHSTFCLVPGRNMLFCTRRKRKKPWPSFILSYWPPVIQSVASRSW